MTATQAGGGSRKGNFAAHVRGIMPSATSLGMSSLAVLRRVSLDTYHRPLLDYFLTRFQEWS